MRILQYWQNRNMAESQYWICFGHTLLNWGPLYIIIYKFYSMPTSIFFLWHQETCCICCLNAIRYYKSILWYIYYLLPTIYYSLPSRVFKMDQFSKVADGVALFLAVGRPGAKFQASFTPPLIPHHVSGKRCKTYFHKNTGEYYRPCLFGVNSY